MAGRDYKQLLKLHRENSLSNEEKLKTLSKLADTQLVKYKKVKYDVIKDFINERKKVANGSLTKVQRLEEAAKLKKELLYNKYHKYIWLREWSKLNAQRIKSQDDLDGYLKQIETNIVDYAVLSTREDGEEDNDFNDYYDMKNEVKFVQERSYIDEFEQHRKALNNDLKKFEISTLEPIFQLNDDLKYYISVNRKKSKISKDFSNIKLVVQQVKTQQLDIQQQLELEYIAWSDEVDAEANNVLLKDDINISEGIPNEAYELDAPDYELKTMVLNEFLIIDEKYRDKLAIHEQQHQKSLSENGGEFAGWSKHDHEVFQHIYESYNYHNPALTNCNFTLRDLMFDRMKRTMELYNFNVTRPECVQHEEWMRQSIFFHQQHRLILTEWLEARKSLLIKAEAIFQEAFEMIEAEREKQIEREEQLKKRQQLYDKLRKFREQKMEALEIQQRIDAILEAERREKENYVSDKERKRREALKQDIDQYHEQLEADKRRAEAIERRKLEALTRELAKQAMIDRERVDYRRDVYEERKLVEEKKRLEEQKEAEEKEKRIEKFLESVKPNVEADPIRLLSFTQAEYNRRGLNVRKNSNDTTTLEPIQENYEDKKQMYNMYSYTDKQLHGDARMRIEQKLRNAGLINNEYAKEIIKQIKPPTVPRRDANSNPHWDGFNLS